MANQISAAIDGVKTPRFYTQPIPQAILVATAATGVLTLINSLFNVPINWIETLAVLFSFACVWLCVKQSRANYYFNVVATILLAYVMWQAELFGSMALNIYLLPTFIYGWYAWGKTKNTLPVQHVKPKILPIYLLITAVTYIGATYVINYFGGQMGFLDGMLLVGSILAQYLLDRKKIETWIVWMLVNIISIYVYFQAGLFLIALQFILFLANSIYAYFQWRKEIIK